MDQQPATESAARSRTGRSTGRGEATRERILAAADAVLTERGYAGTSISTICERAGVAPTSVYWHFGSKAGLIEAVLRQHGADHFEGIRQASAGGEPLDRLERMLAAMRQLATTRPPGSLTALTILAEGRHVAPELREALRRIRLKEIEDTAQDIAAAAAGRPHPDFEAAAVLTAACANYAGLTHAIEGHEGDVDHILDALRRAIVALVGPHLSQASQ